MRGAVCVAGLILAATVARAAETPAPLPSGVVPAGAPPEIVGWAEGSGPAAPDGFRVSAFAHGLDGPRWLAALPNGDLLVAHGPDRVTLLRDADRDGVAEQQFSLIEGLDRPSGMLLRRDRLYVADAAAVWSFSFLVGQTRVNSAPRKFLDLGVGSNDGNWTRSLATDQDERRLYVAVGAGSGTREKEASDPGPLRAAILSVRWDGSDAGTFASGLRSPAGMAFAPEGGRLWAVVEPCGPLHDGPVTGRLTEVRKGLVHEWPCSCPGEQESPDGQDGDPGVVADTVAPDLALGAGAGPLGLAFYRGRAFPGRYRGGAFVGLGGSWDGSRPAGYRVVFVPFEAGRPAGPAEDFLTGFVADEGSRAVRGRPAGVAVARDGALLVADDGGNAVWRIAPVQ
jgi:glucose/arabinose dehydrogenase